MHGLATMTGIMHMRAWPEIAHSVTTGLPAFNKVFGKELFEHVTTDAEAGPAFDEAMAGYVARSAASLVNGYDFSRFNILVDVGGGNGALLAAVLKKVPALSGINFDLPKSAERSKLNLGAQGLAERCEVIGGDFFQSVPSGGDAYALKMILHDWDDAKSVVILKNVRKAMNDQGTLLIVEAVLDAATDAGSPGKLLDMNMLVMTGGRERSAEEFTALLSASGFRLVRIVPVNPMTSVVEAVPV